MVVYEVIDDHVGVEVLALKPGDVVNAAVTTASRVQPWFTRVTVQPLVIAQLWHRIWSFISSPSLSSSSMPQYKSTSFTLTLRDLARRFNSGSTCQPTKVHTAGEGDRR